MSVILFITRQLTCLGEVNDHILNQHCLEYIFLIHISIYSMIHLKIISEYCKWYGKQTFNEMSELLSHNLVRKWAHSAYIQLHTILFCSNTLSSCLCMRKFWLGKNGQEWYPVSFFNLSSGCLVYFGKRQRR